LWSSGDHVAMRYLRDGRAAWVRAVTVVEDTAQECVLFLAAGAPTKVPVRLDGTPIPRNTPYEERFGLQWKPGDGDWAGNQTLLVTPHEAAHSIWLFWTEAWEFEGWYVNLQRPLTRTPVGFDTVDQVLDLWVRPDLSWSWKDEHELEAASRLGRFSPDEAAAIRAEGERVVAAWPFPTGWEDWRPDPSWPIPQLPEGWDRV
jgi:Protein of unknown function (DUF402)